ncbi:MAG: DUF748 domain-containing protein [Chryseolinea sp.]
MGTIIYNICTSNPIGVVCETHIRCFNPARNRNWEFKGNIRMKKGIFQRRGVKILLIVVAVLVIARLILPYVVLRYANKTLANMKGYYGHVDDIDIALIRGAYRLDSIYINKYDSATDKQTPFFASRAIDLSVEWKALFHGSIVGELIFEHPEVRFTKDKVEPKTVKNDSSDFKEVLDDFMPLQVNRVEIQDGRVRYLDHTSKPGVDINMTDMHVLALNLRNSYDSAQVLPAKVMARANVYEGEFTLAMKLNPLAERPTFDLNAELKNTNLVLLNDFFKAYAKIDVNKGRFGMYTEVASKEGKFKGYVKPLIKDLDVLGHEDRDDNIFRQIWEGLVGAAGQIFKNQPEDQVATKIPFEGDLNKPDADVWTTVVNVLQNAFIQAIQPSIDNEINLATIDTKKKKGFFERVFDGKDKDDKKAESDDKIASKENDKKERRKEKREERKKEREERRQERKKS